MILIVDLCYEKESLSHFEFVHPIANILEHSGFLFDIRHFRDVKEEELEKWDKIILCGTALKDNIYGRQLEFFDWISCYKEPILGICAGMQVISIIFDGDIVPQPAIGMGSIEIVNESPILGEPREIEGYHLHNYGVTLPKDFQLLAQDRDKKHVEAFRHHLKPIYGILFHPEVRNRWILEKFADLR